MNILEIRDLCKNYGQHIALDNVSLNVAEGSVYGILGPNGAGKTTLLRIINSILVHDKGSVKIAGIEAELGKTSHLLGYMPEERGLYPKMKVEEQIMFFGRLKGKDKATLVKNMHEYMDIFHVSAEDGRRKVEELSKGNQQKVQIISTIVHEPPLIILDEPFSGFDPINGQLLADLIARLQERNSTIILSSHNMPAIEDMATHIALINHGRLLLEGELDAIKEGHKNGLLEITVGTELSLDLATADNSPIAAISPSDAPSRRRGFRYTITPKEGASNNEVLDTIALQANILHFEEALPSLSQLFLQYAGK